MTPSLLGVTVKQPSGAKDPTGHAELIGMWRLLQMAGIVARIIDAIAQGRRHWSTLRPVELVALRPVSSIPQRRNACAGFNGLIDSDKLRDLPMAAKTESCVQKNCVQNRRRTAL